MVHPEALEDAQIPPRTLDWIAQTMGPRCSLRAVVWMGRSSTEMHALEVVDESGQTHRLALRRYA